MSNSQPKTPKHILKLSSKEKQDFLESFDNIFSDLDGVIWNIYAPIPNAEKGFKLLENAGKKINYISNNSSRSMETSLKKFQNVNLDVHEDNIYHPARSIVKYLKNINFEGQIYLIGSKFFKETLISAGFEVIDSPNEIFENAQLYQKLSAQTPVRAVVLDFDANLSFFKLTSAQLHLKNPECLFIGGATDMFLPVLEQAMILGPGQFLKLLKDATKREPIILGKPSANLGEILKKDFQITNSKRALMIGDTLEQDIGFGNACGFQTLAVLTGTAKLQDLLDEKNPELIPDYYANSMGDFIEFFEDIQKSHM